MQSDFDVVDFKPFLDAVVGILFILLILITAQMFFTQWADVLDQARERDRQARLQWENESAAFLNDLADQLRASGTHPVVDLRAKSVSLPLADLARVGDDRRPHIDPTAARVGRVLAERLLCLSPESSERPTNCPKLDVLRLGRLEPQLHVAPPQGGDLSSDAYAYYFSIIFSAEFVREAPGLLTMKGSKGSPAVQVLTHAATAGSPTARKGQEGDLSLQFIFDAP